MDCEKYFMVVALVVVIIILLYMMLSNGQNQCNGNGAKVKLGSDPTIVFYQQKWCGHCKRLEPTWDKLNDTYKKCKVIKLDCATDDGKRLALKNNVTGFPTIKFHPNGIEDVNGTIYSGNRSLESIIEFCDKSI